ncbi:aldehyde dehydrogenase family protein [Rhodococcus sp. D2-41]|uniref:aldehyde dehydrogenase family protein n=1 Tax=Speluncibacter jeojiensis TaxID=2710754 RepID=UPI00240F1150|nr:aldehyde dehydrogenase family protein [Rhodococcus sp. D2-41]MDG3011576.1 aldehyde dehydrogenase family protein [Rhodococcus sp. D2-41]
MTTTTRAQSIDVCSPADGRTIGTVRTSSAEDVRQTVSQLRAAQPQWAALPVAARVRWMHRFRDWIYANEQRINNLLQAETGKPPAEIGIELSSSLSVLHYYCDRAEKFLADETPWPTSLVTALKALRIRHVPYQVVGVISPWNFPLAMFLWDAIPALLAGAAVIVKPSEHTPLAATAVLEGWTEIGAPPVFTGVNGAGSTGAAVVNAVDFIQFTGTARTGTAIAATAAAALKPYSLELGGNDPAIVLADADLDQTAQGIVLGGMLNSGQMCVSVERVYAVADIYDELVTRVADLVRSLRDAGDGFDVDITGLITADQLEIVTRHVDDAVAKGATAVTGGRKADAGQGFEPTVLTGVDHTMAVMNEETFGPVLPIMRVADVDEAIRLANDSPFGLSASVWSRNRSGALRIAARLEAGTVNINDAATHILCHPIPQSGWKTSGVGARLGGPYGIRKFTRTQAITANRIELSVIGKLAGFPYSAAKSDLLRRAGRLDDGGSITHRLGRTQALHPRRVEVQRSIPAPAMAVFDWLADGSNFAKALPGVLVRHTRRGVDEPHGVGAVREVFSPAAYFREEIIGFERPTQIRYVITRSLPLVSHLGATIDITNDGSDSCLVTWVSEVDGGALAAGVIRPALSTVFRLILSGCERALA